MHLPGVRVRSSIRFFIDANHCVYTWVGMPPGRFCPENSAYDPLSSISAQHLPPRPALMAGGVREIRNIDVLMFVELVLPDGMMEPNAILRRIDEASSNPIRFERHEFVTLCLMLSIALYSGECNSDPIAALNLFVQDCLAPALDYPLNPFPKILSRK